MFWVKAKDWLLGLFCLGALVALPAFAQDDPFQSGGTLSPANSNLPFETISSGDTREMSSFEEFTRTIDEAGNA